VQKWQSTHYNFVVDRGMRAFINDFVPFSEKEMYDRYVARSVPIACCISTSTNPPPVSHRRSYEVEPRSGSHVGRG
jgi:hypothetical protein